MTHGGAGSLQDAVCHATPVLGVPVAGDQPTNLAEAEANGFGETIAWRDVDRRSLGGAVARMVGDRRYAERAKEFRDLLMDQPMSPLDRGVWWMEYLLRHPGESTHRVASLVLVSFSFRDSPIGLPPSPIRLIDRPKGGHFSQSWALSVFFSFINKKNDFWHFLSS